MGLLRMAARTAVVAGTATAVSGRVARRQAARYDDQQYGAAAAVRAGAAAEYAPEPPAPRTTTPHSSRSWRRCTAQGVLTDEEFAAAKAKILGL